MSDTFLFNTKQWLADDAVLLMDWDVRAMHLHLMCLAWQQKPKGQLPNNEKLICKWLSLSNSTDWQERIKPQLLRSWNVTPSYWIQQGLLKALVQQKSHSLNSITTPHETAHSSATEPSSPGGIALGKRQSKSKKQFESAIKQLDLPGFDLSILLKLPFETHQKANEQQRVTIWNIGVGLLKHESFDELKARQFLGKLIQEYGEPKVAELIAQLSLKNTTPVDAKSYLLAMLKSDQRKAKLRGRVAL